jgi:hypothetical protein
MRFFIDQNVPDSVGRFLMSKNYEVVHLRTRIPTDSPDTLVAAVAEANDAILVTFDADLGRWPAGSESGGAGLRGLASFASKSVVNRKRQSESRRRFR